MPTRNAPPAGAPVGLNELEDYIAKLQWRGKHLKRRVLEGRMSSSRAEQEARELERDVTGALALMGRSTRQAPPVDVGDRARPPLRLVAGDD